MTSIDDLRRTLAHRADALADDALAGRSEAVRRRGVELRRRRRAAVAGVAAVVLVAAAGAVVAHPHHDASPPPTGPTGHHPQRFYGNDVPSQLAVLGQRYVLDGFATGDGSASLDLEQSSANRVVAWGLQRQGDTVSIAAPLPDRTYPTRSTGGNFQTTFVEVDGHNADGSTNAGRFTVSGATGQVALAVYTEQAPDNLSFAPQIDGSWTLVRSDFEGPGLSYSFTGPAAGDTRVVAGCVGDPGEHLALTVDDADGGSTACSSGSEVASSSQPHLVTADAAPSGDQPMDVSAELKGETARLGVAFYEQLAQMQVLDQRVPNLVDYHGHVYRLLTHAQGPVGQGASMTAGVPDTTANLLVGSVVPDGLAGFFLWDGEPAGEFGAGLTFSGVRAPGTGGTVTLDVRHGAQPDLQVAVVLYQEVE